MRSLGQNRAVSCDGKYNGEWRNSETLRRSAKILGVVGSALAMCAAALPALALDYEAKPVGWVLLSPFRTAGGLVGGTVCGLTSSPIDHSFHDARKFDTKLAGQFGDERGPVQRLAVAPVVVPVGLGVGGVVGVPKGFVHGFKIGWNKPLSRWSFITMEEK